MERTASNAFGSSNSLSGASFPFRPAAESRDFVRGRELVFTGRGKPPAALFPRSHNDTPCGTAAWRAFVQARRQLAYLHVAAILEATRSLFRDGPHRRGLALADRTDPNRSKLLPSAQVPGGTLHSRLAVTGTRNTDVKRPELECGSIVAVSHGDCGIVGGPTTHWSGKCPR